MGRWAGFKLTLKSTLKQLRKLIRESLLLTESVCPSCGNKDAYIGLRKVECPSKSCKFFSQEQLDAVTPKQIASPKQSSASQALYLIMRFNEGSTHGVFPEELEPLGYLDRSIDARNFVDRMNQTRMGDETYEWYAIHRIGDVEHDNPGSSVILMIYMQDGDSMGDFGSDIEPKGYVTSDIEATLFIDANNNKDFDHYELDKLDLSTFTP